jgi:hypothetical protein
MRRLARFLCLLLLPIPQQAKVRSCREHGLGPGGLECELRLQRTAQAAFSAHYPGTASSSSSGSCNDIPTSSSSSSTTTTTTTTTTSSWKWWEEGAAAAALRARAGAKSLSTGFGGVPESSTVAVAVKESVPDAQVWSRCEHCGLEVVAESGREVLRAVLFDHRGRLRRSLAAPPHLTLSSSKWSGFFHQQPDAVPARYATGAPRQQEEGNDSAAISYGSFADALRPRPSLTETEVGGGGSGGGGGGGGGGDRCERVVTRPVFVFPVLTWQVGHLLVDVLEPLYNTILSHYGRVPDIPPPSSSCGRHPNPPTSSSSSTSSSSPLLLPVLVFEVASQDEDSVLLEKLIASVWEADSPFALLRLFVGDDGAFFTTDSLRSLVAFDGRKSSGGGLTCFTDLHLGLDAASSYYFNGFDRHPHFLLGQGQQPTSPLPGGGFRRRP